uniref:REP-associated tyrosine transposase n=1 Tax=uncultured Bacteroides sp. TaxID=162156 RepID=UPI0025E233D5|nr:transposase [uncultured Bacteroides sp.]
MNTANRVLDELYFITTTVVDWVDIFTRPKYKHILLDSLTYCQQQKGLKIYAWVLMSNHLHAIVSAGAEQSVADIIRDFKKFTSKRILEEDPQESRREWMLDRFRFAGANDKKITNYRFWQDGYHPKFICSHDFYRLKLNYIHDNPVRQEVVARQEEYRYSSAVDYAGGKGLLEAIVHDR